MRKTKLFKVSTVLLLCFLLTFSLFIGCTKTDKEQATSDTNTDTKSTEAKGEEKTEETDELSYLNKTGYPIVNEAITLELLVKYNSGRGVEPSKSQAWEYVMNESGINLEFTAIENSAWTEKKNLILAGGDLPDVIYNGLDNSDLMNQARTGNFIDYSGYLEEYAPGLSELMVANEDIKNAMVMPDGSVRSMVWTNMEIEKGQGECPPDYIAVNGKWLDVLNLEMPTTIDEFFDVCMAFRNDDPNGNGLKDEIPIAPYQGMSRIKMMVAFFGKMFDTYDCFVTDEGVVEYVPFTDEYKQYLEFMIEVYANELIDQEIFTMDSTAINAKGSGETDIYGVTIRSAPFAIVGQEKGNDFEIAPPFQAPNGDTIWYNRQYATSGVWAITKECEYVEAAVRLGNMFYSDEYLKVVWMGVEGEAFEYAADGSGKWDWIYTDELTTPEEVRAVMTIQSSNQGPSMCPTEWFDINDPVEGPVNEQRRWMAENYGDTLRVAMPAMYFNADVQKEIGDIDANIKAFHEENLANFIRGTKDMSEFDDFIAQLKAMGAERMVELIQQTYDENFG